MATLMSAAEIDTFASAAATQSYAVPTRSADSRDTQASRPHTNSNDSELTIIIEEIFRISRAPKRRESRSGSGETVFVKN
jgi:hypothetical protein